MNSINTVAVQREERQKNDQLLSEPQTPNPEWVPYQAEIQGLSDEV